MMKTFKTFDSYIKDFPSPTRTRLNSLRRAIRAAAPEAEESISYGMPGYKLAGRPLVYFGGFKKHVSLFAMPSARAAFKKELAKYKGGGKSAVQFQNDEPIPLGLIQRMVKFRVKENLALAARRPAR